MLKNAMKVWAALGLLVVAPICASATEGDVPREPVSYADLDLTKLAGDKVLYNRIRFAAQSVCRSFEGRQLAQVEQHHKCLDSAIRRAVADVNQPDFLAYCSALYPHKAVSELSGAANSQRMLRVSGS
jgi:UrcA family protein